MQDQSIHHPCSGRWFQCRDEFGRLGLNRSGCNHAMEQGAGLILLNLVVVHESMVGLGQDGPDDHDLVAIDMSLSEPLPGDLGLIGRLADQEPQNDGGIEAELHKRASAEPRSIDARMSSRS